jgi:hypothetical protein
MSASKIVTVVRDGEAAAEVIVLTQPVSIKQTAPKETINAYRSRRSPTTTEPVGEPARCGCRKSAGFKPTARLSLLADFA